MSTRIKMLSTKPGSDNGAIVQTYVDQLIYDVSDDLAYAFIEAGDAEEITEAKRESVTERIARERQARGESMAETADGDFGAPPVVSGDGDPDVKAKLAAADAMKAAANTVNVDPNAPPPVLVPVVDVPSLPGVPAPDGIAPGTPVAVTAMPTENTDAVPSVPPTPPKVSDTPPKAGKTK